MAICRGCYEHIEDWHFWKTFDGQPWHLRCHQDAFYKSTFGPEQGKYWTNQLVKEVKRAMTIAGDPFRRNYGTLTDTQKEMMDQLKVDYEGVWRTMEIVERTVGKGRDMAVARTKLQDSCHWAVRAVTKTGTQE